MAGTIGTPLDLIHLALKTSGVVGIGQTPDAEDVNDCFVILNAMLAGWSRERWLVYHLVDTACMSTGALSYTVGTGGDFNIARTDQINSAYARLQPVQSNQPIDFYLSEIFSREDYSAIGLKEIETFPGQYFYDSGYPMGSVFFYPHPKAGQFEFHIVTKSDIPTFATLTQTIVLPPEYIDPLIWNLSVRIRPLYQLPPDETIIGLAKNALAVIRSANTQIPTLATPPELLNSRRGFDPTAGNFNGIPWGI